MIFIEVFNKNIRIYYNTAQWLFFGPAWYIAQDTDKKNENVSQLNNPQTYAYPQVHESGIGAIGNI